MAPCTRSSPRSRWASRWLLPLLLPLLGAPVCNNESKIMDPNLQHLHSDDPVEPAHASRPVRDVPAPAPAAPAVISAASGSVRPHANAQLNGRSGVGLPTGPWHLVWSVPLEPTAPPEAVLQAGERIVVQALGRWSLHDRKGTKLAVAARVTGDVVIDPDAGLFFYGDVNGFLSAARLDTGAVDSIVEIRSGGSGYSCTLLWRRGRELAVHGFAQPQMSHEAVPPPDHTLLEVIDLGDPVVKDDIAFVTSSRHLAGMSSHTVPFLVATGAHSVMMAVPGHVYRADDRLKVKHDLTDDFEPVALSLDEHDRAHLVVRTKGAHALWILDVAAGERSVNATLPGEPQAGAPPIIGHDHRTFVRLRQGVVALEPDGRVAWTIRTSAPPVGATIAKNGVLAVSAGSQVLLVEPDGRSTVAFELGEPLTTAPVLVSDREILVASAGRLVSASPGPRP